MSISPVNNNSADLMNRLLNSNQGQTGARAQNNTQAPPGDVFQPSASAPQNTSANRFRPDMSAVHRLNHETNQRTRQLIDLVERMFGLEARTLNAAVSAIRGADLSDIDPEVVRQAQLDIGDDGYWGVEQTSQRILDFARAISGGDPSRINILRDAVERGFAAAERQWGGDLPEISQRTLDAVRRGFDEWEQSFRNGSPED